MVTLQNQLDWEEHYRDLGRTSMASKIEYAKDGGRVCDTPVGSVVLRRYLMWLSTKLAKDITTDLGEAGRSKAYSVLLKDLNPDTVALIALSRFLSSIYQDDVARLATLAHAIGKDIYSEIVLANFRDVSPDLFEALINDLNSKMSKDLRHKMTIFRLQAKENGIELPEWTTTHKIQVGTYLLNLMAEEDDTGSRLVEIWMGNKGRKTVYNVGLAPESQKLSADVENSLIARSGFAAPCIYPPQDWTGEEGVGGFYGALKMKAVRFFKGSSFQWEVMNTLGHDPSVVLSMLNAHQKTPWKVNNYILDLLKGMRYHGYSIKKKVEFGSAHAKLKPERPEFLDRTDTADLTDNQADIFLDWKKKTAQWHTEAKRVSRVEMRYNMAMSSAESMVKYGRFWYVYQVDSRGRMYPVSGPLNPQGSDVQKALLHAADGEPVDSPEALFWFKLSIAAKYGIDKLSPSDCVKWVDDNHDNIIRAASNPIDRDAFSWWSDADKPLQFIAVCDEYARYTADPENFRSRIAVAMDGTCNGLQNYSAMLRDEVGGRATNLISSPDGIPNDIYGDVAKASFKRLTMAVRCAIRDSWIEHGFNRKLTKKSVMTQVYGSTFGTCRKSIMEYCYENELFESQEYEHSDYAAHLVWDGIGDVVVKAKEAMDWLRKSAGLIMKEGADYISYPTPTGYRVVQVYDKFETLQVQAHIGKKVRLRIKDTGKCDGPDKMRHRNALPPNFIHSIDSSHMAFVSVAMEKLAGAGIFMHFIHDDFGVLPKHAVLLAQTIREQFVHMHSNYDLENLRLEYPFLTEPPSKGNLDINCVLDSVNFFR